MSSHPSPTPKDDVPDEQQLAAQDVQSTNQPRTEPAPASPADEQVATSGTREADDLGDAPRGDQPAGEGVGAPAGTVPDVAPALGTSEEAAPVEGVHTPDVGPGGDDLDTARPSMPGRTTQSADEV